MLASCRSSSPIRRGIPPLETRSAFEALRDIRDSAFLQDVDPEAFQQSYLLRHSLSPSSWSPEEESYVNSIRNVSRKQEESLYTGHAPLLRLLNHISEQVSKNIKRTQLEALFFYSGDKTKVTNPFSSHYHAPDIIVVKGTSQVFHTIDYSTVHLKETTWCSAVAVGEAKVKKSGQYQLANYLRNHLQLHPELNATLGLTIKSNGYALFYHDANVIHRATFRWDKPAPLYSFIETLYARPFQDTSMQILDPESSHPAWATMIGSDIYLSEAPRAQVGPGQRRYTTTAVNLTNNEMIFIKDIWRDERRSFFEASLFQQAHEGKPMAGLMLVHSHGYVTDDSGEYLRTSHLRSASAEEETTTRYKMRMVTGDIGRRLEEIKSLRHFLCVMYDACAVGAMPLEKAISTIYRDCKPKPECLVVDLGNGADLRVGRGQTALTERTDNDSAGVTMPSVDGPLGDYCPFMHTTEYQATNSSDSVSQSEPKFSHRLFHDAESTFWVIAWTLVRSTGEEYQLEKDPDTNFRRFYHTMCRHYPIPEDEDSRSMICKKDPKYWISLLHPDLQIIGPMLSKMFVYIRPEWAYRQDLDPEHAHEALMRLLLAEIIRIDMNNEDVPIAIGRRAVPPPPPNMPNLPLCMNSASMNPSISRSRTADSMDPRHNNIVGAQSDAQLAVGLGAVASPDPTEYTDRCDLKDQAKSLKWRRETCKLLEPN
ncbi:hypothetical protein AG1IA_09330 [Rhizoctonia solani AG-1 IA]|uniref:Fungal-type protein kinase domain-containing protein n=1 Tax=Thanatephorus cucumeris (strain AG1-IA) TaxID=983506 RepID=L8WFA0_THACA|nr:hypothetical protein AG1IA_09330 [Rhizoctonia solani AG-1 IA]